MKEENQNKNLTNDININIIEKKLKSEDKKSFFTRKKIIALSTLILFAIATFLIYINIRYESISANSNIFKSSELLDSYKENFNLCFNNYIGDFSEINNDLFVGKTKEHFAFVDGKIDTFVNYQKNSFNFWNSLDEASKSIIIPQDKIEVTNAFLNNSQLFCTYIKDEILSKGNYKKITELNPKLKSLSDLSIQLNTIDFNNNEYVDIINEINSTIQLIIS